MYQENDTNIVFYNQDVPLIITVEDSFSGISEIEWSIANDNKQGTITVNENGDIQTTGDEAIIINESIGKDSNLVTSLQFMVTVTSDTKDVYKRQPHILVMSRGIFLKVIWNFSSSSSLKMHLSA